jgi:hypothetical protein
MGVINKGILGGFSGKTGTVIGSSWRGQDVMRGLSRKSDKAPTPEQLEQRARFGLITHLLSRAKSAIGLGFRSALKVPTPMNVAVSDNLAKAVTGVSPNFTADPLKLSFSKGSLSQPTDASISGVVGAELKFDWSNDMEDDQCHPTDEVNLVVYNPVKAKFVFVRNAAMRSELTFTVQLPLTWDGDTVYAYLFTSEPKAIGKACSDTLYIGTTPVI